MHIIIDGYNLIRQSANLRRYERISLEEGRNALIHVVSLYKKKKGHKMTIVFDGWEQGAAEEGRDYKEGLDIIYSRKGEKADDVIKRMAEKGDEQIVVVTSDRDLAGFVSRRGGVPISSQEFEDRINRISAGSQAPFEGKENHDKDEDDDQRDQGVKRKGSPHRLSRKKKLILARMRKL